VFSLDARKPTPAARPQQMWALRPSARGLPNDVEFPQQGNATSMWKTTGLDNASATSRNSRPEAEDESAQGTYA